MANDARRTWATRPCIFGNRPESTAARWAHSVIVFLSMSPNISIAMRVRRASVYRYAAAGSPSTEPKLPWPSTSG